MAARVAGTLYGGAIPMLNYVVGSGGVTKGDLLVASSGTLVKATGGADAGAIIGIAVETASATAVSEYVPLAPGILVSIPVHTGDTVNVGSTIALDATTLELSDDEASTYHRVRVLKVDPSDSTRYICVSIGWAVAA